VQAQTAATARPTAHQKRHSSGLGKLFKNTANGVLDIASVTGAGDSGTGGDWGGDSGS